jgi:hypothetical protein
VCNFLVINFFENCFDLVLFLCNGGSCSIFFGGVWLCDFLARYDDCAVRLLYEKERLELKDAY